MQRHERPMVRLYHVDQEALIDRSRRVDTGRDLTRSLDRQDEFLDASREPGFSEKPGLLIANRRNTMPAYEFQCKQCSHRFTVAETYKEHERHQEKCPKCGSRKVEQLMSSVYAKTSKKS